MNVAAEDFCWGGGQRRQSPPGLPRPAGGNMQQVCTTCFSDRSLNIYQTPLHYFWLYTDKYYKREFTTLFPTNTEHVANVRYSGSHELFWTCNKYYEVLQVSWAIRTQPQPPAPCILHTLVTDMTANMDMSGQRRSRHHPGAGPGQCGGAALCPGTYISTLFPYQLLI